MKALVLGATGRIGNAIVRELLHHGALVSAVSRHAQPPKTQRPLLGRAQAQVQRLRHPYFDFKRRMEAKIRRAMRDGMRAVIVSPTFRIGPGDISDPDFAFIPMIANGALPATNDHALNVMDVRDGFQERLWIHHPSRWT